MLDIACGQGRIALLGAKHFEHVHGIDISPAMLATSQQSLLDDETLAAADVTFEVGDVRTFTAEHPCDVVTAFRFFLNAEDDLRLDGLRCARRNIAPGGTFIANVHVASTSPLALFYGVSNTARRCSEKTPVPSEMLFLSANCENCSRPRDSGSTASIGIHFCRESARLPTRSPNGHLADIDRLGKLIPGLSLLSQAFVVCASPM